MEPVESTLEITTRLGCVIPCELCPQHKLAKAYVGESFLRFEPFKTYIDKVPDWVQIDFSGFSEPWLNSYCTDMVEYAAKHHDIYIYTTLVGMKYDDAGRIARIRPKHLGIHIRDAEDRSPIRDANLLLAETLRPNEYIAHGHPHPSVVPYLLEGVPVSNCRLNSRAGSLWTPGHRQGALRCSSTRRYRHNVLLPNGDVVLCCMDYGLEHRLGNLLRDSYEYLFAPGGEYRRVQCLAAVNDSPLLCRDCELSEGLPA